jgi:hypothetical protein
MFGIFDNGGPTQWKANGINATGNAFIDYEQEGVSLKEKSPHNHRRHNGSNNSAYLEDSYGDFGVDALIGEAVTNVTDGSSCTITDNDGTTATCTLTGGTDNDWDFNDLYSIPNDAGKWLFTGNAMDTINSIVYHVQFENDDADNDFVNSTSDMDNNTYYPDGTYFCSEFNHGNYCPSPVNLATWKTDISLDASSTIARAISPPTIIDPTEGEQNVPTDGSDPFDATENAFGTHYATDWKAVLQGNSCDAGAAQGTSSSCDISNKTSYAYTSLPDDTNLILCVRTYVDWDANSDCDAEEATAWSQTNFSTGAQPPQTVDVNVVTGTGIKRVDLGTGTSTNVDIQ